MSAQVHIAMELDALADVADRFRSHRDMRLELPAGAVLRHGLIDGVAEALTVSFPPSDEAPNGVVIVIETDGPHVDLSEDDIECEGLIGLDQS